MKRNLFVTLAFVLLSTVGVFAQKYAFIDTEYILDKIPQYQTDAQQIDKKSEAYKAEVTKAGEAVQKLYDEFQNKANTLSDKQMKETEERIMKAEKTAMELGRKYFGPEGEIAKLKETLLDPYFDKIYAAAKQVALQQDYAAIIDRATATSIIFAQPKYDISDEIIRMIK